MTDGVAAREADTIAPRVGLIGCGDHGVNVLLPAALGAGLHVVGVHDINLKRLQVVRRRWSDIEAYDDSRRLRDRGGLDGMLVALPGTENSSTAIAALADGLSVFVEKPPGVSRSDVAALAEAEAASSGRCVVGLNFRYATGLQKLREVMADGPYGDPLHVRVVHAGKKPLASLWGEPELLHGLFFAQGIHAIDLATVLSGDIWLETAHILPVKRGAALRFTYLTDNGTGEVLTSSSAAGLAHRVEILTSSGALLTLMDLNELLVQPGVPNSPGRLHPGSQVLWRRSPLANGFESAGYSGELAAYRAMLAGETPDQQPAGCGNTLRLFDLFDEAMARVGRQPL